MKKFYLLVLLSLSMFAFVNAQTFPPSLDTNYTSTTILASPTLDTSVVFRAEQHWVRQERAGGYKKFATAPREHDYMYFEPDAINPNTKGYLIMNHERSVIKTERPDLGEGGGMSIVKVEKVNNKWKIINHAVTKDTSVSVDFSTVGWTTINCGGAKLPNGNHLTGEEIFDTYNTSAGVSALHNLTQNAYGYDGAGNYTIPASYPEFGGQTILLHQNFGWMTEVNPTTGKAVKKCYHMGRFSHEGGVVAPDNKTIYLTDDYTTPAAILFKFVADVTGDFSVGNLYAFKQNPGSYSGTWVQIPRTLTALLDSRNQAISLGATLFARLEWASYANGRIYIAETGMDNKNVSSAITAGATTPQHWKDPNFPGSWNSTTGVIDHPYGSVLVLDDNNVGMPSVKAHLNGGTPSHGKFNFASVDGINTVVIGGKTWLVLQEDIIGRTRGRVRPNYSGTYPHAICEAFLLDASIINPTLEDLHLLFIGSRGAEVTGATFTPDGNTLFINNQHPEDATGNSAPFDKTATIAVSGYANFITGIPEINNAAESFIIYPNPVFQELHFNKEVNATLFDSKGVVVGKTIKGTSINVIGIEAGLYFLKTEDGKMHKVIIQ